MRRATADLAWSQAGVRCRSCVAAGGGRGGTTATSSTAATASSRQSEVQQTSPAQGTPPITDP